MRTRLSAARKASGSVGRQLLRPADKPDKVIVGTWKTRANWEAWQGTAVTCIRAGRRLPLRGEPR
jgi:heme-degrading monooxygenase HmoA